MRNDFIFFVSLVAISLTSSTHTFSFENRAIVSGGSCESIGPSKFKSSCNPTAANCFADQGGQNSGYTNLFRAEMTTARNVLLENNWNSQIMYDGGKWEKPFPEAEPSSRDNLKNKLAKIRQEIDSGILKPGDQLMIALATHGMSMGEHYVCMGDNEALDVTILEDDLKYFTSHGLKVLFLDNSCFSGMSVSKLKDTGACILSSTNPNTTGSGDEFWKLFFASGSSNLQNIRTMYSSNFSDKVIDLDGDGFLSANEAYWNSVFKMKTNQLPRMSECSPEKFGITSFDFNKLIEFVRAEMSIELKHDPLEKDAISACSNSSFKSELLFAGAISQHSQIYAIKNLLKTLAVTNPDFNSNFEELKTNINSLQRSIENQNLLIAPFEGQNKTINGIDSNASDQIQKINNEIELNKRSVLTGIKKVMFYACYRDFNSEKQNNQRPCDDFKLWKYKK